VGCTNIGIASSTGSVIHVLAAGWRATDGWTDRPLEHFAVGDVAAVVPLGVDAEDRDRVVSAGIRHGLGGRRVPVVAASCTRVRASAFKPAAIRLPTAPGLEAGFWSADVLKAAGPGFSTACGDQLADADMAAAVACTGGRVVLEPASHVVCGGPRTNTTAFGSGLYSERLFWRSLGGRSLLPALFMHAVEIARHSLAVAPLGTLPMLIGRLTALMQFGSYVPRARELKALRRVAQANDQEHEARTLRIDEAHERLGGPRRQVSPAPLKRSA
jgi:hypothetical protein